MKRLNPKYRFKKGDKIILTRNPGMNAPIRSKATVTKKTYKWDDNGYLVDVHWDTPQDQAHGGYYAEYFKLDTGWDE